MDSLDLLKAARQAGLEVRVDGDRLVVRGPKSLEPLAKQLLERKSDIVAALSQRTAEPPPSRPCLACGSVRYWLRPSGGWVCATCHPAPVDDVPEVIVLRDIRKALQDAVLELAEAAGWPRLSLDGHRTIVGTRTAWTAFTRTADVPTLRLAVQLLKEKINEPFEP